MSPATDFSVALLTHLVARGLRHVVLTPGSRSQALALAAAALDRRGILSLTVRLDERSAAFTALGLARESGLPAAIITTSGTAVGNLLPAVMEAHHSGVPLIVLSADRPAELRGTGANQTTWQPGIFGAFVRLDLDVDAPSAPADEPVDEVLGLSPDAESLAAQAMDASRGRDGMPGPVHLNLQFREPLSGDFPEITVPHLDDPAPSHPTP
ncbi:thiamine pyrophosphate-binding protein, partial [Agreia sp.]|uniref:thiamine pyrophosphate-binding protein n=1 Tax=Agreia sp. TaxID=1872416 RepID=UPI0035BC16F5